MARLGGGLNPGLQLGAPWEFSTDWQDMAQDSPASPGVSQVPALTSTSQSSTPASEGPVAALGRRGARLQPTPDTFLFILSSRSSLRSHTDTANPRQAQCEELSGNSRGKPWPRRAKLHLAWPERRMDALLH